MDGWRAVEGGLWVEIGARVVLSLRHGGQMDTYMIRKQRVPLKQCVKRALGRLALYSTIGTVYDTVRTPAQSCMSRRVENS